MEKLAACTLLEGGKSTQLGSIVSQAGHWVELRVPENMPVGSSIKMEMDDTLSLGEVAQCRPVSGGFQVCLEISEALRGMRGLASLMQTLNRRDWM